MDVDGEGHVEDGDRDRQLEGAHSHHAALDLAKSALAHLAVAVDVVGLKGLDHAVGAERGLAAADLDSQIRTGCILHALRAVDREEDEQIPVVDGALDQAVDGVPEDLLDVGDERGELVVDALVAVGRDEVLLEARSRVRAVADHAVQVEPGGRALVGVDAGEAERGDHEGA